MTLSASQLADLKQQLIKAWDRPPPDSAAGESDAVHFQALHKPKRPRAGLAIGHTWDPITSKPRLEFRVTAPRGPNFNQAQRLVDIARAQGVDAVLKFSHKPVTKMVSARADEKGVLASCRRPLHIGVSVAHEKGSAGSLGAFVRLQNGEIGILSCTHVLAFTAGRQSVNQGDPVHQPGPADQDPFLPSNRIGGLTEFFAPFISHQVNNLDAAIAKIDDVEQAGPVENVLPDLPIIPARWRNQKIGTVLDPEEIEYESRVVKFGRSSGFTENAVVTGIDFQNVEVQFEFAKSVQSFIFSGVIEVQWDKNAPAFTKPGDSGALVLTSDGLRPIGIHFSAEYGGSRGFVMPLKRICDTFGVSLL